MSDMNTVVNLFPAMSQDAPDFAEFWRLYPRRVARVAAQRAWAKLDAAARSQALAALPLHVADWADRERRHIPHASTWLNGQRWLDELDAADELRANRLIQAAGETSARQ